MLIFDDDNDDDNGRIGLLNISPSKFNSWDSNRGQLTLKSVLFHLDSVASQCTQLPFA